MRVCLVTPEYPPRIGGLGYSVARIAQSLRTYTSHEIHVAVVDNLWGDMHESAPDVNAGTDPSSQEVNLHHLHVPLSERPVHPLSVYQSMSRLHQDLHFDLVIAFSVSYLGFPITFFGLEQNTPVIVSLRGKDIHTDVFSSERFAHIRWTLENSNGVVAVSRDLLQKAELVVSLGNRGTVIHNCVHPSGFAPGVASVPALDKTFIIATAGVFRPSKGLHILLGAASRAAHDLDLSLLLVGDARPHESKYLSDLLTEYRDKLKIWITGFIEHRKVLSYLRAADVVVVPSIMDGGPNVLLEGMLAARPIIATKTGYAPEAITDGTEGLLVEPDTEVGIARAILRLARESDLRASMGNAAYQKALTEFSPRYEAEAWQQVFETLVRPM